MNDICNSILHRTMCDRAMDVLVGVENCTRVVEECVGLEDVRESLYGDVGMDVLLEVMEGEMELEEALLQEQELELAGARGGAGGKKSRSTIIMSAKKSRSPNKAI